MGCSRSWVSFQEIAEMSEQVPLCTSWWHTWNLCDLRHWLMQLRDGWRGKGGGMGLQDFSMGHCLLLWRHHFADRAPPSSFFYSVRTPDANLLAFVVTTPPLARLTCTVHKCKNEYSAVKTLFHKSTSWLHIHYIFHLHIRCNRILLDI